MSVKDHKKNKLKLIITCDFHYFLSKKTFMSPKKFIEIILRGISQIMLVNNVITGILFLIGIFYNSWLMGIGAIIGVLTGTFTAMLLKYNKNDIDNGLYGYNSTLVGLGIIYFFEFNVPSIIAVIVGATLSTIIMRSIRKTRLPAYTAPFIISTWILLVIILKFHIIPLKTIQIPTAENLEIIPAFFNGIGQVMFQENVITGIIFLIGLMVYSRISTLYAVVGSVTGIAIGFALSFPINMLNMGLFGFNGVLCGIVFSNKNWYNIKTALISIIISIFIIYGMINLSIMTLTSPFVLSTWLILIINNLLKNKIKQYNIP